MDGGRDGLYLVNISGSKAQAISDIWLTFVLSHLFNKLCKMFNALSSIAFFEFCKISYENNVQDKFRMLSFLCVVFSHLQEV
jgi:hypothetical protein